MHALGVGEVVLDKIHQLSEYPEEGTKISAFGGEYSVGGPVAAGLIVLARLGVDCTLVASMGDDKEAEYIVRILAKDKIRLVRQSRSHTKVNHVLVNQKTGSRTIIKEPQSTELINHIPQDFIKSADVVVFDRHEPRAFAQVMNQKRRTTFCVIDPSTEVSKKTLKMCALAEYPILPQESLNQISLGQLYHQARKPIIITRGKNGCSIYNGSQEDWVAPLAVHAIDTLGAGDVFRGAMAYGILNGWHLHDSCRFGNVVAGLQCTRVGNGTAIPSAQEIWEVWNSINQ